MKRLIPFIMLLMTAPLATPVQADLIHRLTSSTQLSVDGAATAATRVGSTYAVLLIIVSLVGLLLELLLLQQQ